MHATIEKLTTVHKGWNTLFIAAIRLEDGRSFDRVIEDHGRAAAVLAYDPQRKCATLVRQLRVPPLYAQGQETVLEAVAGLIDDGDAGQTAEREAMEEAGLRLRNLDFIANTWSIPGTSTERVALYLAEYGAADRVGAGGGLAHEHEDIEVVELPLAELAAMLHRGEIDDMKTLALTQALMLRRPELF